MRSKKENRLYLESKPFLNIMFCAIFVAANRYEWYDFNIGKSYYN